MSRKGNLKPIQPGSDAREKGRKGGIASGKSRQRRKKIAGILTDALKKRTGAGKIREELAAAGMELDAEDTNAAAFAYSILLAAMEGNMQAARLVLELLEEDPQLKHKQRVDGGHLELKEREVKLREDGW